MMSRDPKRSKSQQV